MELDEVQSSASEDDVPTDIDRDGSSDDSADMGFQEKKVCSLYRPSPSTILRCHGFCIMPELARTQVTAALQKGQDVPFEQLEQMRQHGGITKQQIRKLVEKAKAKSFKRENKNRPMEMSSKRPVPRLREVVEGTKRYVHAFNFT